MNTRSLATVAAVILAMVLGIGALYAYRALTPPANASPNPIPTATVALSTASATPLVTLSAGRYYGAGLGYSIETPPPWHRSSCSPALVTQQGAAPAAENFVSVSARDESQTDVGPAYPTLWVTAWPNPQNLSPRQWSGQDPAGVAGERIEEVVYADRPAVRKIFPGTPLAQYFVPNGGRMYSVEPRSPHSPGVLPEAVTLQAMLRMIDSFRFLSDAESAAARAAVPAPLPPRTPEQVADGVTAALTAKDADAVAGFLSACVTTAAEQAGGVTVSREKYVSDLRAAFASGLVVSVQPRPFEGDRVSGNLTVGATWRDARGTRDRKLMLRKAENDRWEWWGTLCRCDVSVLGSY